MYQNIATSTTTTTPLTALDAVDGENGNFDLRVTNSHTSGVPIIDIHLTDSTGVVYYIIRGMRIPVATAVTFPTRHDTGDYALSIVTQGSACSITLMRIYD
tara:strand:+ start:656 stop:958 length:303 start_codon:yes stop_codon:yes gene_type:complete